MAVEEAELNYNIKLGNYNVLKSKLAWNKLRVYEIELNVFPMKFWFKNHWHWETSKDIIQSCLEEQLLKVLDRRLMESLSLHAKQISRVLNEKSIEN